MISENIKYIKEQIQLASELAGRKPDEITLIAVSKTKPISMLREAYQAGIRDFGENKVQELIEKFDDLPADARFHMIGHLQRNKVKYIIGKVCLIHSVDSLRLAEEISRQAIKKQTEADILLEVNVAQEDTKQGILAEEVIPLARQIALLPAVHIKGLMTVAPYADNSEENRHHFKKLNQLAVDIKNENIDNVIMDVLSMGMTGDYLIAVEEGATYVRVGTGVFGERDYA